MKRFQFLTILLISLSFSIVFAQEGRNGTVKGVISDKVTGEPLIGASIAVEGTGFGAASNLQGEYIIHNIKPGTYTLLIRYIGYQDVDMPNIEISAGQTIPLDVQMIPMSENLEEVVITVQAKGQIGAINQERAASGIVNVVSSDKIKEVPDATAAESIGRLPGVALKRSGGEGNQVVIRGMSPQFSIIEIDGVRMTGTGGDRSVGLSTISPEMLDGIELSKSLSADKDADAIGGVVNLRTATAASGFHVGAMVRGGYNGLDNNLGDYKFSGSISNRFLDNKIGALLNVSNERVNRSSHRMNTGYATASPNDSTHYLQTNNTNIEIQKSIRYRTNGNLVLDYKNDFMDIRFNNIYSQMTMDNENRNNQFRFNQSDFQSVSNRTSPKEIMQSHNISGLFRFLTTELDVTYAYSKSTYENFIDRYIMQDPTPPFNEGLASTIPIPELYFKQPEDLIDKWYQVGSYSNITSLRNNERDTLSRKDITQVVNLNWKIPFAIGDKFTGKIKVGFKYSDKQREAEKERVGHRFYAGGIGDDRRNMMYDLYPDMTSWDDLGYVGRTGIPGDNYIIDNYDWGNVLDGVYQLGWGPNLPYLIETHETYYGQDSDVALYDRNGVESAKDDYVVTEKLTAGYIMAELNIGSRIHLVPGVRYEVMKTTYSSFYTMADGIDPSGMKIGYPIPVAVDDRQNAHFFPSINMKIEATDWIDLRAAYYKSTSRPNFSLLSPGITSDQDNIEMRAYNPYLEPSTAHNYDLGISFYTPKLGLFSANLFYKEMTDLLYRLPKYQPKWFDQLVPGSNEAEGEIPVALYESLQKPRHLYPEDWFIEEAKNPTMNSYPINNPNQGSIKGIELSWQTNFWYLPGAFRGLVLDLNYTYMQSAYKVPYIDFIQVHDPNFPDHVPIFIDIPIYATDDTEMPDQPSNIFNARIGYDYRGFSTRLSFRYETIKQTGFDQVKDIQNKYIAPLFRMDLNVVQNLGKGFSVFMDIMNLTNAMDIRYVYPYNASKGSYDKYRSKLEHYGLTAQLGLRYKL